MLKECGYNLNCPLDREIEIQDSNTEKDNIIKKIINPRKMSNDNSCYWIRSDSVQTTSWMYFVSLANMLLAKYDLKKYKSTGNKGQKYN